MSTDDDNPFLTLIDSYKKAKLPKRAAKAPEAPKTPPIPPDVLKQVQLEVNALIAAFDTTKGTLAEGGKRARAAIPVIEELQRMIQETVQEEKVSSADLKAMAEKLKDTFPDTCAAVRALPVEVTLADAIGYAKLISSMLASEASAH